MNFPEVWAFESKHEPMRLESLAASEAVAVKVSSKTQTANVVREFKKIIIENLQFISHFRCRFSFLKWTQRTLKPSSKAPTITVAKTSNFLTSSVQRLSKVFSKMEVSLANRQKTLALAIALRRKAINSFYTSTKTHYMPPKQQPSKASATK